MPDSPGPQPCEYTVDAPQDGCFWHALDKQGLALFKAKSPSFGKITTETAGPPFAKVRYIRCRPDKPGVTPWKKPGGAILAIPKNLLASTDWRVAGRAGDVHLKGQSALAHGHLWQEQGPQDQLKAENDG